MAEDTATAPPPVVTTAAPVTPAATDSGAAPKSPGAQKGGFLKSFHELKTQQTAPKAPDKPTEPSAPAVPAPEAKVTPVAVAKDEKKPAAPAKPPTLKQGLAALDEEEQPAVPVDPPVADDEVPAHVTTEEGKGAWKGIKTEIKGLKAEKTTWETERTRLTAELEASKKISDADPAKREVEALRKRVAELEPVVARSEYKQSEDYKKAVDAPMRDLLTKAAGIAVRNSIDQNKIEAALWEADEKRQNELLDEIAETLPGRDKDALYGMANKLTELIALDDDMSKNASVALAEANRLAAERAGQSKTERRAQEMRRIADSKERLEKNARYLKLDGESDADAVKAILDEANSVPIDELGDETVTDNKVLALTSARFRRNLVAALGKITELEAEVTGLSGAAPRTTTGSTAAAQPPAKKVGGFFESMREGMAGHR